MEYLEEVKKQYKNMKLGIFDSIHIVELLVKNRKLGVEDTNVLPMEGVAIKMLLEDCKKRCGYEERYRICENCGKHFIAYNKINTLYCDRPAPQNPSKTCKQYGKERKWLERTKDENDWYSWYRKTYQLVQGRVRHSPQKYNSPMFKNFQTISSQWINDVKSGKKTGNDFIEWLKNYRKSIKVIKKG